MMRGKDIVRVAVLLVSAAGLYAYGAYLQLTYATEPPYLYFWLGVIIEFAGRLFGGLAFLYCLLRLFVFLTARFVQPQYRRS